MKTLLLTIEVEVEDLPDDDRSSDGNGYVEHAGIADTPALALLVAALRCRKDR